MLNFLFDEPVASTLTRNLDLTGNLWLWLSLSQNTKLVSQHPSIEPRTSFLWRATASCNVLRFEGIWTNSSKARHTICKKHALLHGVQIFCGPFFLAGAQQMILLSFLEKDSRNRSGSRIWETVCCANNFQGCHPNRLQRCLGGFVEREREHTRAEKNCTVCSTTCYDVAMWFGLVLICFLGVCFAENWWRTCWLQLATLQPIATLQTCE